ncbi:MAG: hypothetical protein [aquatic viral metagenome]
MIWSFAVISLLSSLVNVIGFALATKAFGEEAGFVALGTLSTVTVYLGLFYAKFVFDTEQGRRLSSALKKWETRADDTLVRVEELIERTDRLRGKLQDTVAQLSPDRSRLTETLIARVSQSMDKAIDEVVSELEHKLNELTADVKSSIRESRQRAFTALPFVKEILAVQDPKERLKLVESWLKGIQGDDSEWKRLADYFRKQKPKELK